MNPTWQTFLTGRTSAAPNGAEAVLPKPATAALMDLSTEGIIAVQGPDARAFLQGQLSTDIDALTPEIGQLSSWSSAKGRVVSVLRILQYGEDILLLLPRTLLDTVLKRLSMYVLRSKVKLADISDTLVHVGLAGETAAQLLVAAQLPAPHEVNAVATQKSLRIMRLHGVLPRFILIGPVESLVPIWDTLSAAGAYPASHEHWGLQKILAREPTIYPETSEHFVAQMIGLEELDAINFKKGCYIGQEIIARAHFRGAVKRHMLRARCDANKNIMPGTSIDSIVDSRSVAEVVDAAPTSQGTQELLIVIQDDYKHDTLRLMGTQEPVTLVEST